MADKNFQVKNGLTVNSNLLVANGDSNRVGINTATPDAALTVNGHANVSGNVTIGDTLTSNVIIIGGTTVNSTAFPGTANNATNFNGENAAYYRNADNLDAGTVADARLLKANSSVNGIMRVLDSVSNDSITIAASANSVKRAYQAALDANNAIGDLLTDINAEIANATNIQNGLLTNAVVSGEYGNVTGVGNLTNLIVSGNLTIGNSTVNTFSNSSTFKIGNSTVYVVANSTRLEVANLIATTVNASAQVVIGAALVNTTTAAVNAVISNNVTVSSNVVIGSGIITIGNSTVNATINSTAFTGSANNATNFNGENAAYYRNADNLNAGTVNTLRLPAANATVNGAMRVLDSVSNDSITIAAAANSVKTAYDRAATAYTNAIAIAANADNLTSGTVADGRLLKANSSVNGIMRVLDSVTNTSILIAASANSVKRAFDAAGNAFSNAITNTVWLANSQTITGLKTFTSQINIAGNSTTSAFIRLYEHTDNGTNYVGLQAPALIASDFTLTLPNTAGTNGYPLVSNGSGGLEFRAPGGGSYAFIAQTNIDSPVANVIFSNTTLLGGTYTGYVVVCSGITISSDGGGPIVMRISSSNSTVGTGFYGRNYTLSGSLASQEYAGDADANLSSIGYNLWQTSYITIMSGSFLTIVTGSTVYDRQGNTYFFNYNAQINNVNLIAFKPRWSSNNITGGVITVWGIKRS